MKIRDITEFAVCTAILILCSYIGTLWYFVLYGTDKSIIAVISTCVVPFIIPDLIKIFIAVMLSKSISPVMVKLRKKENG